MPPNKGIAAVVDAIIDDSMFFCPFISEMGTDVLIGNLHVVTVVSLR